MEILYGRKFTIEELSAQPIREISAQSLIYDSQMEQEYIRQQESKSKNMKGSNMIVGSRDVNELLFQTKYPVESKAIVTLLTTEEFEEEIAKPTDND